MLDIQVLRDKATGQSRGCAFISYGTREEAQGAIDLLNEAVQLPGALSPVEVGRTHKLQPRFYCIHMCHGWRSAAVGLVFAFVQQRTLPAPGVDATCLALSNHGMFFIQVRPAKSYNYIPAGSGPEDNKVLYFHNAPTSSTAEQIKELFEQFGPLESLNLFRERRSGRSKGCGFVTMQLRDQAAQALDSLDAAAMLEVRTCSSGQTCRKQWIHAMCGIA